MYPGDSLVDKIFEEGIKDAQAIIIVVSKHSVDKPWVKEELNASVVKRISKGSLLIPVVIDDCEVPEALKSTLWARITDLSNYEEQFDRIVTAIFNRREKPVLGQPPKYTRVAVDTSLGLSQVDALIFTQACDLSLKDADNYISVAALYKTMADLQIPEQEFVESIEILDSKHYIEGTREFSGGIPWFRVTHYGFDEYLRRTFDGYGALYDQVCLAILNQGLTDNKVIAQALNQPLSVVNHIMENLNNHGLVRAEKSIGGGQHIFGISPELKRHYRNK